MTGNYWEDTVYATPPLVNPERFEPSPVFEWIGANFPFSGTKIDWRNVTGDHAHRRADNDAELATLTAEAVSQRLRLSAAVEHVGDDLSPFGIRFTRVAAEAIVVALLEIPEHHYFVAQDRSWMVVAASEGDLDIVDKLRF